MIDTTVVRGAPLLRPGTVSSAVKFGVMPALTMPAIMRLASFIQPVAWNVFWAMGRFLLLLLRAVQTKPALQLAYHLVHGCAIGGRQRQAAQAGHDERGGGLNIQRLRDGA